MKRLQTWPLPALLAWVGAWALHRVALAIGLTTGPAVAAGCLLGLLIALRQSTKWRRLMVGTGFPLSALLTGMTGPIGADLAWAWLLPVAVLALLYPVRTWGDAPLFPTPAQALAALPAQLPLPAGAQILDAGCGLGHGLQALRSVYPTARFAGVEWSAPISVLARLRCPWAAIRRGDMWADSWQDQALVYLFQRPESMARAWAKACAEMRPGSALVSLEFPIQGQTAQAQLSNPAGKTVWLYRIPAST